MIDRFLLAGAPATVGGTARRLLQLYAGLALYGASMALLVRSALGVMPWDVLHQGLAGRLGWSLGTVTIAVGALVLLAWIPLRQRPGLGTVSNVVVIGLAVDATLAILPAPTAPAARAGFLVAGVLLNAVATAAYIGVHLGPGPRDGLMTGLVLRTGRSVRLVRTSVEIGVVATGWLLGGTLGVGTVVYALAIGPLVQVLLPRLSLPLAGSAPATQPDGHGGDDGEHEQRDRPAAAAGPCREDQQ
ncbi:hypothetical protein QOZ88_19605 [Blastococcus sp. BMG 814]|uniref:Membrane protein YczE n=1 Tax=Blastococcus carthaginiensis TaxID=3050034 RepID=A0ABT9IGZ0_9ACTN|nr:hypothetical protein [Blastococcus carthaginiensis]MDP5184844.1 hypothetical protein [Blastococcus carthaginiensis]